MHPECAKTLQLIANGYESKGAPEKAESHLKEAYEIYRLVNGENSMSVIECLMKIITNLLF